MADVVISTIVLFLISKDVLRLLVGLPNWVPYEARKSYICLSGLMHYFIDALSDVVN